MGTHRQVTRRELAKQARTAACVGLYSSSDVMLACLAYDEDGTYVCVVLFVSPLLFATSASSTVGFCFVLPLLLLSLLVKMRGLNLRIYTSSCPTRTTFLFVYNPILTYNTPANV